MQLNLKILFRPIESLCFILINGKTFFFWKKNVSKGWEILLPNSFKLEKRNPCTFHLCEAGKTWGRGNCAYAEEDAHHAFAGVEMSAMFLHPLTTRRLELPSLRHVSPSASLLTLRLPPPMQTSFGLLQPYRKMLSLEEKQMRNREKKENLFQRRQRNARLVLSALLERAALHSGVSLGGEWCCCLTKDSCWAESLITGQVPALGPSLCTHSGPAICTKFLSDLFVNMDPNWIKDELLSPLLIFPQAPLFSFPAPPLSDPPLPDLALPSSF